MKFYMTIAAAGVLAVSLLGSTSQASILSQYLTFDGVEDTIDDNSRALIYDNNGNDLLDKGDEIVGLIRFDAFNGTNADSSDLIFAIFTLEVSGNPLDGAGAPILAVNDHIAGGSGTGTHDLKGLLDDGLEPGGFVFDGDEFFAVLSKNSAVGADNPFDSDTSTATEIASEMTAANGWGLELIGNFDGVDDFFQTAVFGIGVADLDIGGAFGVGPPDGIAQISEVKNDTDEVQFVAERAVFSIDYSDPSLGSQFLSVSRKKFLGLGSGVGEISLSPDGAVQSTDLINSDVVNDANFRVNPVPEPGSIMIWSLLGVMGLFASWRRSCRG